MTCGTTSPTGPERPGGQRKKWRPILGMSASKGCLPFTHPSASTRVSQEQVKQRLKDIKG